MADRRKDYALSGRTAERRIRPPLLPYAPRDPKGYRPPIALIGCGGITESHLTAYKSAGYNVVALCDLDEDRARKRQAHFYPGAAVYTDYRRVLERKDVEVVDVATYPMERVPIIEAALRARKHVLSQKPFVLDLSTGDRLVKLAAKQGVKLAVNQNGRWAPHFAWIRHAVARGLIGDLMSVHAGVHWDHTWTVGTPFENFRDLVLYDFGIHWFDMVSHLIGRRKITRVYASKSRAVGQRARPPMLAQAIVQFAGGQASLIFDAHVQFGPQDRTYIGGTKGAITSMGPNLGRQLVTLYTAQGTAAPVLKGRWFPDGFHGTMGELLCAIAEKREPLNGARENLRSLALCFAAIAAATDGKPRVPGTVRRLPPGSAPGV
ncbi:MAG: Gfo/Idh/MocA family oxidoreductase [bacterium]|mgnify:FL=1